MKQGEIETARLVLEPLRLKHATLCFQALSDPNLYTYVPQDPPVEAEQLRERYQSILSARPLNEIWLNWFGRSKEEGTYICFVQATLLRSKNCSLIAYQTFYPHRRRGFAKEACSAVLRHLAREYSVKHVVAEMDTRNLASRRLVESLGFRQIGVKKNADYFKGNSSDEFVYQRDLGSGM